MSTVTVPPITLAPAQFPAGSPSVSKIRVFLQNSGGTTIQFKDVNPGEPAVFTGVSDGQYRIAAQAMSTSGFIGTAVTGEPFTVDSQVTLSVPVSIGPPAVVA
jgi:hypothetical protein